MAKTEIRVTVNTSGMEKTLEIIARHCAALAAELKQAREYPHGITDDRGRPIRPDGSLLADRARSSQVDPMDHTPLGQL